MGGAPADHKALVHQNQLPGDELHVLHHMGTQQDDLVPGDLADEVPHRHPLAGVKARRGLVQHQDIRVVEQRLRQKQPLLHASGPATDGAACRLREIQPRQGPVHALFGILPAHALEGRHVIEKLLPGEARVQGLLLGAVAQSAAEGLAHGDGVLPVQGDAAPGGLEIPGEDVHEGAFARAVGA